MTCVRVALPLGGIVTVCTKTRRCVCGRRATLYCDWKVPTRRSGTCDAPICSSCTTSPGPDKDVCPKHRPALEAWLAAR